MIEVPDNILFMDPLESNLAFHFQQFAKKFKWKREYLIPPRKLGPSEASEVRKKALKSTFRLKPLKRYVPRSLPNVPSRDFICCVLCNKEKSRDNFIYEFVSPDLQSWHGWCRKCTTERRVTG